MRPKRPTKNGRNDPEPKRPGPKRLGAETTRYHHFHADDTQRAKLGILLNLDILHIQRAKQPETSFAKGLRYRIWFQDNLCLTVAHATVLIGQQ